MAMEAFDLAERFQTLVFVMSDLDLGMNTWMADPFAYPDKPLDRGKLLDAGGAAAAGRMGPLPRRRRRRHSVPHDPGRRHAGVFHARVRPQRKGAVQRAARRLRQQHGAAGAEVRDRAAARARSPTWSIVPDAEIGIIGYGTSHWAIDESRDQLERETGIRPRISGCGRIRSPRSSAPSSIGTSGSTSSSRTATRRC